MTSTSHPSKNTIPSRPPELPPGTSNSLRGISENFSFHSSPETFIASRIAQWQKQDPTLLDRRTPIRAKILNRNVAVVSSYEHIHFILNHDKDVTKDEEPAFVAGKAYRELMNEFFPPPNLLLADGCPHREMRQRWNGRMTSFRGTTFGEAGVMANIVRQFLKDGSYMAIGKPEDLYETMKTLSWQILLGTFLGLAPDEKLFGVVQELHEDLLRGQFSLLPISVNVRVWQSPRSKGTKSRKILQDLIAWRLHELCSQESDCSNNGLRTFIEAGSDVTSEEMRDHVLMMTSSLAVKGLASLLTAFFLNLFLFKINGIAGTERLKVMAEAGQEEIRKYIRCVYLETERLSPPIVGIMRRLTRDVILENGEDQTPTLLPKGWDTWLYFVGAGRDHSAFGKTFSSFDPTRYFDQDVPDPLAFGTGPKTCLGKSLIRDLALIVAEQFLANGLSMGGRVTRPGVRGWLGWQDASPEEWTSDMKQLPTQRPSQPIMVTFVQN